MPGGTGIVSCSPVRIPRSSSSALPMVAPPGTAMLAPDGTVRAAGAVSVTVASAGAIGKMARDDVRDGEEQWRSSDDPAAMPRRS